MKYLGDPQSGSRANVTASRNRYGQYYRTRAIPVNPNSAKQTSIRTSLASSSQQWQLLTDAQRTAFREFADAHPITNSLGQVVTLTGFAMFVKLSLNLFESDHATLPLTDPPADTDVGPLGPAITVLSASTFTMTFSGTTPTGGYMQLQATPQVSAGRSFAQGWRFIAFELDDQTSPVALHGAYLAVFGAISAGYRVFLRGRYVNAGGWAAPWEEVSRVVA